MGSVYEEISRLETAKLDIETAIETCGVNVPDTELIDTYASYIRQIPSAVFSELNVETIGGSDKFIQSIKQTNGKIEATVGGLVSSSYSGLVPKIGSTAASTITTSADEWVLTSTKGAQPTWRKLPNNAFKNDTYTFTGGNGSFIVTPSGGTAQTVSIGKPATAGIADKLVCEAGTSNVFRHVWFSYNGQDGRLVYDDDFTYNPATNVLKVGSITGNIDWTNITNKPTSFTPSSHNHPSSQINALTNYTKATMAAALATTDTLNVALGKLEYKADLGVTAYNLVNAAYDGDSTIENLNEILKVLEGISDTDTIQAIIGKYLPLSGGIINGDLSATGKVTFLSEAKLKIWNVTSSRDPILGKEMVFIQTSIDHADPETSWPAKNRNDLFLQPKGGHVHIGPVEIAQDYTCYIAGTLKVTDTITASTFNGNATTATDADTLDGYHAKNFVKTISLGQIDLNSIQESLLGSQYGNVDATENRHYPIKEAGGLVSIISANGSTNQIYGTFSSNKWFARGGGGGISKRTSWKEFAFLNSNVASATKLQTSRTIWGQSFNGTANISGALTNTGTITPSSTHTYNIGSSSLVYEKVYTRYIDTDSTYYLRFAVEGVERMIITTSGNIGIGTTNPSYKLHVAGQVASSGFIKSGSSDSYILLGNGGHKAISDFMLKSEVANQELNNNLTTITKSLTVTADWMDTGISSTNIPTTGTYIVQVRVHNTTNHIWYCYWSGIMSWYASNTDDVDTDEIILHRSGHFYENTIYLRTVMQKGSVLKLQIAANRTLSTAATYTFKFKRVI